MTVQIYNKNGNLNKIINFSPRCLPKLPFGGRKSANPNPIWPEQITRTHSSFPLPILYNVYISNVRIEYPIYSGKLLQNALAFLKNEKCFCKMR